MLQDDDVSIAMRRDEWKHLGVHGAGGVVGGEYRGVDEKGLFLVEIDRSLT